MLNHKDYYKLQGEMKMELTYTTSQVSPEGHNNLSFAQMYKRLGGLEGYLTDPKGDKHYACIKSWENNDPHKTFFRLAWRYSFNQPLNPNHSMYPGRPPKQ